MSETHKRPILFRGEQLGTRNEAPSGFPAEKVYPRTYEQALAFVKHEFQVAANDVSAMSMGQRTSEVVMTVKLAEGFLAKSYTPNSFFKQMDLVPIGSRILKEGGIEKRLHFVRADFNTIISDVTKLGKETQASFRTDLRKIDGLSVKNNVYQKVVGFDSPNSELIQVEIILHALSGKNREQAMAKLQEFVGANFPLHSKSYTEDGPIFVNVKLPSEKIEQLREFNPLRTVHPFQFRMVQDPFIKAEAVPNMATPLVTSDEKEELPIVGVFDGGTDRVNEFLSPFVTKQIDLVRSTQAQGHGSLVAGTIIYGSQTLESVRHQLIPRAKVMSVRAFPEDQDHSLYDVIDGIERVVAANPKIDVFNISFGPDAPIDDEVDRFTYSIDNMAYKWHKLFIIAVGNSGEQPDILKRIQAPSDAVNALGVGAYYLNRMGKAVRALYSSIGPGREGGKIKPDILALGGNELRPLHLIGEQSYVLYQTAGTSFAAPEVAADAAILLANTDQREIDFLAVKALLINGAELRGEGANNETGWGVLTRKPESLLMSDESSVTIVFEGTTFARVYTKLRIPLPQNITASKVHLTWTTVTLAEPDANSSEAYTRVTVEETLFPNEDKKGKNGKPESKSANIYLHKSEEKRRKDWFTWDTTVKHSIVRLTKNFAQPYLRVHAMSRDGSDAEVKYAIAMRIDIPNYDGDLYEDIRNEFEVLSPIQLSTQIQQKM